MWLLVCPRKIINLSLASSRKTSVINNILPADSHPTLD